jgi:predicted Rossmann fold nucleotide-binding protein DprA/Smf involved in DNA uptake
VVDCAADVLFELGTSSLRGLCAARPCPDGAGDRLLGAMPVGEPCDLDALAATTGLEPPALLLRLLDLELGGIVRRAGGGRFMRVR